MTVDRTVFAEFDNGAELVRYEIAGKWYIEHPAHARDLITLDQAVSAALQADRVYQFRTGGQAFKGRYRKRLDALTG